MTGDRVVIVKVNINGVGIYRYITIISHNISHNISHDISCDIINGDDKYKKNYNTVDCVDLLYQLTP